MICVIDETVEETDILDLYSYMYLSIEALIEGISGPRNVAIRSLLCTVR